MIQRYLILLAQKEVYHMTVWPVDDIIISCVKCMVVGDG